MRRPGVIRRLKKRRQWSTLDIVVELPVVQIAATQGFVPPALGHFQPWAQLVNRIHGTRVVDVVGRDQRGIECARTRGVENLIREAALVGFPCKDTIKPEILRPDIGTEILPFGVLRILWWFHRVRADVAEPAGHADTIGFHQVFREVVTRIFVVARRVPFLGSLFIKVRIGEEPQSHNACCIAIEGSDRYGFAACPDCDTWVFRLIFVRIWRTVSAARIQPQPVSGGIRAGCLFEARFIDEAEIVPASIPVELQTGM